jgi:alpha-galactosidase
LGLFLLESSLNVEFQRKIGFYIMQLGAWSVNADADGELALWHTTSHLCLEHLRPRLHLMHGVLEPDKSWKIKVAYATSLAVTYTLPDQVEIILILRIDGHGEHISLASSVKHLGLNPIQIQSFEPLTGQVRIENARFTHAYTQGVSMAEMAWVRPLGGEQCSDAVGGLTTTEPQHALVLGFTRLDESFYQIRFRAEEGSSVIHCSARMLREGIALAPEELLTCADLTLYQGSAMQELLGTYATQVAHAMGARPLTHPQPIQTGWCSWYYYYGTENEQDILNNINHLKASWPELGVIQIDDGWNLPQPGMPRNWGDWQPGAKFPRGMAALAQDIHKAGFKAGLWLAPFTADVASDLLKQHPDWMIQNDQGQPSIQYNTAGLDLSHPEVLAFIRETFERVFHAWQFDYVKIDFLVHAIRPGRRHDPTQTSAQAFHQAMRVIREVAGPERFILNCGSPFGPAIGLADGMRIGFDVSSRWALIDPDFKDWPLGNCAILPAAVQSVGRQWMHNRWWQNDPDCLVTRAVGSEPEQEALSRYMGGKFKTDPPYGLSDDEAGFWVRLVWLLGGMSIASEKIDALTPERQALLARAWPPNPHPAQVVDYYEQPDLVLLRSEGPVPRIGLFNWGNQPLSIALPPSLLGLSGPWKLTEWLTHETLTGTGTLRQLPSLPPHAGRIWEVQPLNA